MTVIDMRAHARKASIARVEKLTADHTEFQAAQSSAIARLAEDRRQRNSIQEKLNAAIREAWGSSVMGPHLTKVAINAVVELLETNATTFRDTLELLTAGKE
jgi:hypothetical protein